MRFSPRTSKPCARMHKGTRAPAFKIASRRAGGAENSGEVPLLSVFKGAGVDSVPRADPRRETHRFLPLPASIPQSSCIICV
jgi:hypothetical protein